MSNALIQSPWPTKEFSGFRQPNLAVPAYINPYNGEIALSFNRPDIGGAVASQVEATGTIYTVPNDFTLEGFVVVMVGGASGGTATVEAATGPVVLAEQTYGGGALTPLIVPITVAGISGGEAISVAVAASGALVFAAIAGYLVA